MFTSERYCLIRFKKFGSEPLTQVYTASMGSMGRFVPEHTRGSSSLPEAKRLNIQRVFEMVHTIRQFSCGQFQNVSSEPKSEKEISNRAMY